MRIAIEEAFNAKKHGDYAIGAAVVKNDKVIVKAGNRVRIDQDPTHHAEIVAIRAAAKLLGTRHLEDCILYTTHEPCPMCCGAAIFGKMKGIVSGARIEDMAKYRANNGSTAWSWRVIDVPARLVIAKGDPVLFLIEEFMRDECVKLFHS